MPVVRENNEGDTFLETTSEEFAEFLKQYARENGFKEPEVEVYSIHPTKDEISSDTKEKV